MTLYGRDKLGEPVEVSRRVRGHDFIHAVQRLQEILLHHFLTDEMTGATFVAWNGNRFDAIIIAAALLTCPQFALRPYLTRTKQLRGLKVTRAEDRDKPNAKGWEFCDGIAMLGLVGVSLARFVDTFAPDFPKLKNIIDFEGGEVFDPDNEAHRAYAMRDSEGLYHGMVRAQQIMLETFDEPLAVTMGGACIKVFAAHIPPGVTIDPPHFDLGQLIHTYVMRGGFCYCVRRYSGPVWKYDINQAYAAAMRESRLPVGHANHGHGDPPRRGEYIIRLSAAHGSNAVPFYYRSHDGARVRSVFSTNEITDTWLTSTEHRQLIAEGWRIKVREWFAWSRTFTMRDYVDRLERLRTTCEGGPSGPIGTMVKATGNHSYGKTVEQVEPIEYIIAAECPDDCLPFYDEQGAQPIEHVFYRVDTERRAKAHHQPHIGAWITAHVRMVLRRAALLAPDAWLYADTDCLIFSRDVTALLDIDAKRYGAYKIEEAGTHYAIIAKKVYTELETEDPQNFVGPENPKLKRSAKGLNVKRLRSTDFADWYAGRVPVQFQTQSQNFLAVMSGAQMYREQRREGTKV